MRVKLGLAQVRRPEDGNVIADVERYCARAKSLGVDILAFPELLMTPFTIPADEFRDASQPLDGPFPTALRELARRYGLWMVATVNESNLDDGNPDCSQRDGGRPFNTALVIGPDGTLRSAYRKTHLFDVGSAKESDKMSAGRQLCEPVKSELGNIAVAICYDLRFPEIARDAALQGADLMFYPAAWYDAPGKLQQWRGLLVARAIENEMFVAGVCRADEGCKGHSLVAAPDGSVVAEADDSEQLLVCEIDTDVLAPLRERVPVMGHRRPDLYRRLVEE